MYNAKLAVKEYIERMVKNYKAKKGVSTDKQIDCPKCGLYRGLEFRRLTSGGKWECLNGLCYYKLPSEITPPNPYEFEEIMQLKERLDFIEKNRKLLE